ncbi:MAG: FliH/SctL family protein [Candidatus Margulisbacteria bacterium]|nr:FliH/SctL family protein [Candidatus Margulisiibacteriota bacterium]
MGLIKRNYLEDKGTLTIEKSPVQLHQRREVSAEAEALLRIPAGDISLVKTEAQKIIERARQEADSVREEAREQGRREGRDESAARLEEALATLNSAIKERKQIIKDAEGELLRLSLKIAEQIIRSEVSLHRDVSLNIVSEAIGRVSDREQIIVRVNREDAEYLKRYKDRLSGMLDGVKSFSIIEDSNVEPGGCVIETNLGFIDARISTKLKSIEEALQKVAPEETK